MRLRHRSGRTVHVSYCANVHPAEDVDGVLADLGRVAGPVRATLGSARLAVGLWLSATAAAELDASPDRLTELRDALRRNGLEVVTLNGFPYGGFSADVVKHDVYSPDWTTPDRAAHTVRLARVLAALLPDDVVEGSVSTLPLAWRVPWTAEQDRQARDRLLHVADELAALERRTGRRIRLAVEPEPGCVLETTAEVADWLAPLGRPELAACLDAAHLAVQFEDPAIAVPALAAGPGIAKAQLSAALHVADPHGGRLVLEQHDEPRFLHQVRTSTPAGVRGTADLPEALGGALPADAPWRVHVHLPLHADPATTTSDVLGDVLAELVGGPEPLTTSLEVETYTWTTLPAVLRPRDDAGLVAGIAAELRWVRDRLSALGLQEEPA